MPQGSSAVRPTNGLYLLPLWPKLSSYEEVQAAVATGFKRKKKTFLSTKYKNLLNIGKSLLNSEEIMWGSGYAQLQIKFKDTLILFF